MIELTPIVAVDDELLEEKRDFTFVKNEDRSVVIWMIKRHIKIKIAPPNETIMLIGEKKDWPKFWINDKPALPMNVFSHIKGEYPGVTIRFIGEDIRLLQIIPRVVDETIAIKKRQQADYYDQLRRGKFDMDYFEQYGIK